MPKLKFYDVKSKKSFTTDKYKIIIKMTRSGKRYFAVAKSPGKTDAYRIVSLEFYKKFKK